MKFKFSFVEIIASDESSELNSGIRTVGCLAGVCLVLEGVETGSVNI